MPLFKTVKYEAEAPLHIHEFWALDQQSNEYWIYMMERAWMRTMMIRKIKNISLQLITIDPPTTIISFFEKGAVSSDGHLSFMPIKCKYKGTPFSLDCTWEHTVPASITEWKTDHRAAPTVKHIGSTQDFQTEVRLRRLTKETFAKSSFFNEIGI